MALISCPECKREVSDQAQSCPHCGYPLESVTDDIASSTLSPTDQPINCEQESSEEASTSKAGGLNFKFILGAVAAVAIGIVLFLTIGPQSAVTANKIGWNAVYNLDLGLGIRLTQSKESVDKSFGPPELLFDWYEYDSGVQIQYKDGKVSSIMVQYPNDGWVTEGGVSIDTSAEEIYGILGDPSYTTDDGAIDYFFFDSAGKRSDYGPTIRTAVAFHFASGTVMDFYISNDL